MTFEACDVVVVPFPFSDRTAEKRRPALVISNSRFGKDIEHSVMAMITSDRPESRRWPLDVTLRDLSAAGLSVPSLVRMKLFTIDHRLIVRKAGHLSVADTRAVRKALTELLAH